MCVSCTSRDDLFSVFINVKAHTQKMSLSRLTQLERMICGTCVAQYVGDRTIFARVQKMCIVQHVLNIRFNTNRARPGYGTNKSIIF